MNISISNTLLGYAFDRLYFGDIVGRELAEVRASRLIKIKKRLLEENSKKESEIIFVYEIETQGNTWIYKVYMFSK